MAKTTEKQNKLVVAEANSLRISPRKMRLVTNLVRNMRVDDAIVQLQFTHKRGASMLVKLLKSAVANAEHNFSLAPENLVIKSITCNMGPMLKRYFPRARGSAFVIRHKLAHVNVVLEDRPATGKGKKRGKPVVAKARAAKPIVEADHSPDNTEALGEVKAQAKVTNREEAKAKIIKNDDLSKISRSQQGHRPQGK